MEFLTKLTTFFVNHPLLISIFILLVVALLILESQRAGKNLTPQELIQLINRDMVFLVDVRDNKDYKKGHIVNSKHIPYSKVQERMHEIVQNKDKKIIIIDAMGQHSGSLGKQLKKAGLEDVFRLKSGISGWQSEGLPLV